MPKEAIIAKLKRVIVQLSLAAISLTALVLFFLNPMGFNIELKNQLLSLTTGILTGSLLSLIYVVVEKKFDDPLIKELLAHVEKSKVDIVQAVNSSRLKEDCVYCNYFIRSLPNRDQVNLKTLMSEAKERIWLFTTNLHFFSDYTETIERAVKSRIDVRLLVLKPTSIFVKLRHKELDFDSPKDFFDQMRVSLLDFERKRKSLKRANTRHKFDIKTHLHFPSCMIYIIDNQLILNPILPLGRAHTTTHVIYDMEHSDAKRMAAHFMDTFITCWENESENAQPDYIYDEKSLESFE